MPLFTQKRVAASACAFLDVLIGNEPRKTRWMRAEAQEIPVHDGNRSFWGAGTWMPIPFVISSGSIWSSIWALKMVCWSLMR